jgi:hypothetical protein
MKRQILDKSMKFFFLRKRFGALCCLVQKCENEHVYVKLTCVDTKNKLNWDTKAKDAILDTLWIRLLILDAKK